MIYNHWCKNLIKVPLKVLKVQHFQAFLFVCFFVAHASYYLLTNIDQHLLTTRLWIGLWSSVFCIVIVAVDGSAIVRLVEEITWRVFNAVLLL